MNKQLLGKALMGIVMGAMASAIKEAEQEAEQDLASHEVYRVLIPLKSGKFLNRSLQN